MAQNISRFDSFEKFFDYLMENPDVAKAEVSKALSPAAAAVRLGVSRQRVNQLILGGKLAAWYVYDVFGQCVDESYATIVLVSAADVDKYIASPKSKGGRPVGFRPKRAA
jgi:hypothetical protein